LRLNLGGKVLMGHGAFLAGFHRTSTA
jgi:hypothetical protein